MDFMEMYAQKKMTAEQAASLVKSGDWVDYGWCVNTPAGRWSAAPCQAPARTGERQFPRRHPDVGARDLPDRRSRCTHDMEQLAYGRH